MMQQMINSICCRCKDAFCSTVVKASEQCHYELFLKFQLKLCRNEPKLFFLLSSLFLSPPKFPAKSYNHFGTSERVREKEGKIVLIKFAFHSQQKKTVFIFFLGALKKKSCYGSGGLWGCSISIIIIIKTKREREGSRKRWRLASV